MSVYQGFYLIIIFVDVSARYLSWLERRANNAKVVGSIPSRATLLRFTFPSSQRKISDSIFLYL